MELELTNTGTLGYMISVRWNGKIVSSFVTYSSHTNEDHETSTYMVGLISVRDQNFTLSDKQD